MIELENEKISPLPKDMHERYQVMYDIWNKYSNGVNAYSFDVTLCDGDENRIRSIVFKFHDKTGSKISLYKNYYRNGQLAEGGIIKDGKTIKYLSFYENGEPEPVRIGQPQNPQGGNTESLYLGKMAETKNLDNQRQMVRE